VSAANKSHQVAHIFSVAILTVSDRAARGEYRDRSGPAAAALLDAEQFAVVRAEVVPDEIDIIAGALRRAVAERIALVLTTGGTGFSGRDITPEATLRVVERRADGLTEAMRAGTLPLTPFAMISRAVAGIAGSTLIVNLPGSPRAVAECLPIILPVLPHALAHIAGGNPHGTA